MTSVSRLRYVPRYVWSLSSQSQVSYHAMSPLSHKTSTLGKNLTAHEAATSRNVIVYESSLRSRMNVTSYRSRTWRKNLTFSTSHATRLTSDTRLTSRENQTSYDALTSYETATSQLLSLTSDEKNGSEVLSDNDHSRCVPTNVPHQLTQTRIINHVAKPLNVAK